MIPTFQRIINPIYGDCFKCCLCTILDLSYESVPNFAEHNNMFLHVVNFLDKLGYEFNGAAFWNPNVKYLEDPIDCCTNKLLGDPEYDTSHLELQSVTEDMGINGLFIASVYSPGFTNPNEHPQSHLHSVICDYKFNIIFDPNPNYKDILMYPYSKLIGYNGIRNIDILKKLNEPFKF